MIYLPFSSQFQFAAMFLWFLVLFLGGLPYAFSNEAVQVAEALLGNNTIKVGETFD